MLYDINDTPLCTLSSGDHSMASALSHLPNLMSASCDAVTVSAAKRELRQFIYKPAMPARHPPAGLPRPPAPPTSAPTPPISHDAPAPSRIAEVRDALPNAAPVRTGQSTANRNIADQIVLYITQPALARPTSKILQIIRRAPTS